MVYITGEKITTEEFASMEDENFRISDFTLTSFSEN